MRSGILIGATLITLLLAGCKQEEFPEDQIVSQDFFVQGQIDGQPFDFSPGTNGLFMDTQVEELVEGNYVFSAHIASEDGQGTQGELLFEVISLNPDYQSSTEALSSIGLGPINLNWLEFSGDLNWLYATEDIDVSNGDVFINGELLTNESGQFEGNPGDQYFEVIFESETCVRQGEYFVVPGFQCSPIFEFQTVEFEFVEDEEIVLLYPPVEDAFVIWNVLGMGEMVSFNGEPVAVPIIGGITVIQVTFEVFAGDGLVLSGSENLADFSFEECDPGVIHFAQQLDTVDPVMTVTYISPEGDVHSSFGDCFGAVVQSEDKFIDITNIEDFEMDQNGFETLRFTLNGDINLFNFDDQGNINTSDMTFEDLTIAFPHSN
ncbi:MAG: hypothetical protein HRT74_04620 [Flavobacteriales bacterium]|nr:hypothetical protein [Flavobacteriales bacterium]